MRKFNSPISILVIGLVLFLGGTAFAQTKTAQSAMFDNTASGNFIITGSEVWAFDSDAAATHFAGTLSSGPTVTCSGASSNTGRGCNAAYQPAAPTAPDAAPVPNSNVNGTVNPQSCTFWDGGTLSVPGPHATYTKFVTIAGLTPASGNAGSWKFTWTYTYSVIGDNPVAAMTAWNLQDIPKTVIN